MINLPHSLLPVWRFAIFLVFLYQEEEEMAVMKRQKVEIVPFVECSLNRFRPGGSNTWDRFPLYDASTSG